MTGRVHTAKEAAQLLQGLQRAYRSLSLHKRRKVRNLIPELLESQRRFGSPSIVVEAFLSRMMINNQEFCTSTEE